MDDVLPEYDFSEGARGKYAERYSEGVTITELSESSQAPRPACPRCGSAAHDLRMRRVPRFGALGRSVGAVVICCAGMAILFGVGVIDDEMKSLFVLEAERERPDASAPSFSTRRNRVVAAIRVNALIAAMGILGVGGGAWLRRRRPAFACETRDGDVVDAC